MKAILVLLSTLISWSALAQDCGGRYLFKIFPQTKVSKDIYFGENLDANGRLKRLHFDVYEPYNDQQRLRPVLVMMHGGAYWSGDKDHGQCKFLGKDLSKMGYVLISPQYRYEPSFVSLLNEERMVKAVARGTQDAKAAVRFLMKDVRENGNTWGIDTNLIFVGGASAGAFNALHLAFLDEQDELPEAYWRWINEVGGIEGESRTPGYPVRFAGIVNISGALARANIMRNDFVSFLSIHDTEDPQVPFGSGKPYNIPFLPTVDGSSILHPIAIELGMHNPFYIIPGNGHTSYEEFGLRIQPMYDSTLHYIKHFMYNIYCEQQRVTSVSAHSLPILKTTPNPSSGTFYMTWPDGLQPELQRMVVYDMSGRVVNEMAFTEGRQPIQMNVPAGSYQLLVYKAGIPTARTSIIIAETAGPSR
jgi:para-nitrobenzyl esterase